MRVRAAENTPQWGRLSFQIKQRGVIGSDVREKTVCFLEKLNQNPTSVQKMIDGPTLIDY